MSYRPLILIVDDTPINIQILAEAFRADYRVKVAADAHSAFDVMTRHGLPDLILLDVLMPDQDGYQMCRRLKADPATRHIPVIFVTAKTDVIDEETGLRLGAVDYITKPFHLPIVMARVHNQISLKLKADLLETMAHVDGLTNIPNRRRFDETMAVEWKRARRSGRPLGLVMMDIDFFKQYNDHYGHGAGDQCLCKVALALAEVANRPGDLLARFGGEEFVALLPDTDDAGVAILTAQFLQAVSGLHLGHETSRAAPMVTISAGGASMLPGEKQEFQALVELADQRLYRAKAEGRNRSILD